MHQYFIAAFQCRGTNVDEETVRKFREKYGLQRFNRFTDTDKVTRAFCKAEIEIKRTTELFQQELNLFDPKTDTIILNYLLAHLGHVGKQHEFYMIFEKIN